MNRSSEHRDQNTPPIEFRSAAEIVRPLQILVVEDDPLTGALAVNFAEQLGAIVMLVTSGEAAVSLLGEQEWDIVLVDVGLPGLCGTDVVEYGKRIKPDLPFLMISSKTDAGSVIDAMQRGAEDYIVKPLSAEGVRAAIGRAISRPRAKGRTAERVLAIGAHPDDVEIGIGGILRRHSHAGDDVTILTLTGGEAGGDSGQRVREAHRAAEILGARLIIHGLEDTMISHGPETINVISNVIAEVDPQIVYTHTPNDAHQDHRSAHTATMIAARRVSRIYSYQAPSTTIDFRPARFVRIDDYMQAKLDAIAAHATQGARPYLTPELMHATARYWGRFAGHGLVEPLEVARHTEVDAPTTRFTTTAEQTRAGRTKELVA